MHKLNLQITHQIDTKTTVRLTGRDIVAAVKHSCGVNMPDDASVMFVVPRGGDWSGQPIVVDKDNPVHVKFSVESTHPAAPPTSPPTAPTAHPHRTPYEARQNEQLRARKCDNDDAKLDLIAIALGLDHNVATNAEIQEALRRLCDKSDVDLAKETPTGDTDD